MTIKMNSLIIFALTAALSSRGQVLLTMGNKEVSKEEFVRAFTRNMGETARGEQALKEYLERFTEYKLKVAAAQELKLDTLRQLRLDQMNFRRRLEDSYLPSAAEMMKTTAFSKNQAIEDGLLHIYADSAAYAFRPAPCPIAQETLYTMGKQSVKVSEWLNWAKSFKLSKEYKGESNQQLLDRFARLTVTDYYRAHLEEYNADFRYQLQEFREGNLYFEVMDKKVWARNAASEAALKRYYEANKAKYSWPESAEVILVNARSYAYADYAAENMKKGMHWKAITGNSEGMIIGDSARYEIGQLPIAPGTRLEAGMITPVVKNDADQSAGFVKIIRLYPAGEPRSFESARYLVANDYQQQQETEWMKELALKYPVKINQPVFQSLLKTP